MKKKKKKRKRSEKETSHAYALYQVIDGTKRMRKAETILFRWLNEEEDENHQI